VQSPLSDIGARVKDAASLAQETALERARVASGSGDPDKAAKMFEELLATLLVKEMRRGLDGGFFGAGPGADVYEGWLDQHIGQSLAETGALDLAQSIRFSIQNKQDQEPAR
jgi:Rod binding domain-containing protein